MKTETSSTYRLDIMLHVDRTNGGTYWVWSLTHVHGDRRECGRVDDLAVTYDMDGDDADQAADQVADAVCQQFGIDRADLVLGSL